jgi:hypothetical protein
MSIGTLRENSLHAALKQWYAQPGDLVEEKVGGFVIDIVRGEQLIETQTRHFDAIRPKLNRLLENHRVHVIYPVAHEKYIIRQDEGGVQLSRRRSPRKGQIVHLFQELVRIPALINHPNFTLEVVLVREEELRVDDGRGSWRRQGWSIGDRRLLEVVGSQTFTCLADFAAVLPPGMPLVFTTRELSKSLHVPAHLGRKVAYCLAKMGALEISGRRGRAYLYRRIDEING